MPKSKTYMAKNEEVPAKCYVVDATDLVLGRMSTKIAMILMGKHRPTYTPHVITGDFVVVINAEKVRVTGAKRASKEYDSYSFYPGGRKVLTYDQMMAKHPEKIIELAVKRMLPKNKLSYKIITRLKVYAGVDHPHQAQEPEELKM
jgi:large subunit ribosomal protein L13